MGWNLFGYVRPYEQELTVGNYRLYKALYCGLCDSIRRGVSAALSLSLNYDFVFLAAVRAAVTGEKPRIVMRRCPIHPLKKRPHAVLPDALGYCAACSMILTYEKIGDDLRDPDSSFFKKLALRLWRLVLSGPRKRLFRKRPELLPLSELVSLRLENIASLEKLGSPSLDDFCTEFGELMKGVASFGCEPSQALILGEIGEFTGRLIYTADACDDLFDDEKRGAFNPLLAKYGSASRAAEHFEQLDMAVSLYASRIDAAVGLADGDTALTAIAENVARRGIAKLCRGIFSRPGEKKPDAADRSSDPENETL